MRKTFARYVVMDSDTFQSEFTRIKQKAVLEMFQEFIETFPCEEYTFFITPGATETFQEKDEQTFTWFLIAKTPESEEPVGNPIERQKNLASIMNTSILFNELIKRGKTFLGL